VPLGPLESCAARGPCALLCGSSTRYSVSAVFLRPSPSCPVGAFQPACAFAVCVAGNCPAGEERGRDATQGKLDVVLWNVRPDCAARRALHGRQLCVAAQQHSGRHRRQQWPGSQPPACWPRQGCVRLTARAGAGWLGKYLAALSTCNAVLAYLLGWCGLGASRSKLCAAGRSHCLRYLLRQGSLGVTGGLWELFDKRAASERAAQRELAGRLWPARVRVKGLQALLSYKK